MIHWSRIATDPTDAAVLERRRRQVGAAAAGVWVPDRIEFLCSLAAGKRVLDVGVVDHTLRDPEDPQWLHGRLRRVAARLVGVDVLPAQVARLRELGFDVRCQDLSREPLEERFDLVVLGEVLEHVESPLALLRCASTMLEAHGVVVVTAPNPWYLGTVVRSSVGSGIYVDNADHCAWFDPVTICELADRAGLELYWYAGVRVRSARRRMARIVLNSAMLWVALGIRPELFAKTMIYKLRKPSFSGSLVDAPTG